MRETHRDRPARGKTLLFGAIAVAVLIGAFIFAPTPTIVAALVAIGIAFAAVSGGVDPEIAAVIAAVGAIGAFAGVLFVGVEPLFAIVAEFITALERASY